MGLMDFTIPGATGVLTPAQMAQRQQLADALIRQGSDTSPIQSPWQGAARLAQTLAGVLGNYQLDKQRSLIGADATADAGNMMGFDPGLQDIPATPGLSTPALKESDARNDAISDAQDGISPLASALANSGAAPASGGAASPTLAAALSGNGSSSWAAPAYSGPSPNGPAPDPRSYPTTQAGQAQFIRDYSAFAGGKGIDPNFALGVGNAEGLRAISQNNPNGASNVDIDPSTGKPFSFGAFQLNIRNGLGNAALAAGIDPRDPAQANAANKFAMDYMATHGLQPWRGDAAVTAYQRGGAPSAAAPAVQAIQSATSPAQGAGAPAPSPGDISALAAAMTAQQPQQATGFGLIGSANAASMPPLQDPRLAQAAGLSAQLPPGSPSPVDASQLSNVDRLSPSAAASPLAAPAVPPGVPIPPPRPADASGAAPQGAPVSAPVVASSQSSSPSPQSTPVLQVPTAAGGLGQFNLQAAMRVLSNPWATPAQQQVAETILRSQLPMPPTIEKIKGQDGSEHIVFVNPRTQAVTDGGGVGMVPSGGAGAVPPPPPGVDAQKWRETQAELAARAGSPTAAQQLEFSQKLMDRPSYKEYAAALPTANALPNLAKENSPAGDTALIDSVAKIINPGLAVRQGTYAVYQDEQSGLNKISGEVDKALHQNAVLQPETRAQLMRIANEKMQQYKTAWQADADQGTRLAKASSLNPDLVIPQLPDLVPLNLNSISTEHTQAYPTTQPQQNPPVPGAQKAPDGNWYVKDPARPGKYLQVQ